MYIAVKTEWKEEWIGLERGREWEERKTNIEKNTERVCGGREKDGVKLNVK